MSLQFYNLTTVTLRAHLGISMTIFQMFDFGRGFTLDPIGGSM